MLAPLAGLTDTGMRRSAARNGATLTFSEMVASASFLAGEVESQLRSVGSGVFPNAAQLVGCDPQAMAECAKRLEGAGIELIDVNMGCPARRVAGSLAGSALMRDLDTAEQILTSIVRAVRVAVTVKMRLGWDEESLNAPALARRAEQAGVAMATVHARTRRQFYQGRANWRAVRDTVMSVNIPVVVNGDARTVDDAKAMIEQSGAAAVMIGRGAIGAPWRVGAIAAALESGDGPKEPPRALQREAALEHLDFLLTAMGTESGLRHARKHLSAYAVEAGAPEPLRKSLITSEAAGEAARLLAMVFETATNGDRA